MIVASTAAALSLVTNLVSTVVSPDWVQANSLWLWTIFVGLVIVTVVLAVHSAQRAKAASAHAVLVARAEVVDDLPLVLHPDVASSILPSVVMSAERQVAPFRGRRAELDEVKRWCNSLPSGPSFFVLTGPTLVGKTRLTIQVAAELPPSWHVGRLLPGRERGAAAKILAVPGPHLVVVELGESHTDLEAFLNEVVDSRSERLRVLLVARARSWVWRRIKGVTEVTELAIQEAQRLSTGDLRPHGGVEDLVRWSREARQAFAAALPQPTLTSSLPETIPESPIGVMQARALASLLPTLVHASREEHSDVFAALAAHEMHYWQLLAGSPVGSELPQRCFAASWLLEAEDRKSVTLAVRRVPELTDANRERLGQIADWLVAMYPGSTPDSIGYPLEIVAQELALPVLMADAELFQALTADLTAVSSARVVTRLLSASEQFPSALGLASACLVRRGTPMEESQLLELIRRCPATRRTDELLAETIASVHPDAEAADILLAELEGLAGLERARVAVQRALLRHARSSGAPDKIAKTIRGLGVDLRELGEYGEALTLHREALGLYRDLAADNPSRYSGDIARTLVNLGVDLSRLGEYGEALAHDREALGLYRDLAVDNPSHYNGELARTLVSLGVDLRELGVYGEALAHDREALGLYRDLAVDNPSHYNGELARTLVNLGADLRALGEYGEALAHDREALGLYRDLGVDNPSRYSGELARTLVNLGADVLILGEYREALKLHKEALGLYRDLAVDNPSRYNGELAWTLVNLGVDLSRLGEDWEALAHDREALGLYRDLAADNPSHYNGDLARTLASLGADLFTLGDYGEALTHYREALGLYREVAADNPSRHNEGLSLTRNGLQDTLRTLGRELDMLVIDPPEGRRVGQAGKRLRP